MKRKIFIMTGEASGDLHGALLVKHIREITDDYTFVGIGGSELEQAGVTLIDHYSHYSAMGIVEPLLKIRFYKEAFRRIPAYIRDNGISTVITVDFPGFNLPLAERLYPFRPRVIHYISPQLWAWHYSRIKKIRKYFSSLVVLYPFEEDLYRREGIRAYYHGNPLIDSTARKLADGTQMVLPAGKRYITLLPGSRLSEAKRHLAPLLDAAAILQKKYAIGFLMPVLTGPTADFVSAYLERNPRPGLDLSLVFDNTHRAIDASFMVITSSGTATLEAAILGKPMIIIYKISLLFELLGRMLVRVKDIGLVNIVAGRRVCPELTQRGASGTAIAREASRLIDNPGSYAAMQRDIAAVKEKLGAPGAIKRIARQFVDLIEE